MKKHIGKLLIIIIPIVIAVLLLYPTYRSWELEKLKSAALTKSYQAKTTADSIAIIEKFDDKYGKELDNVKSKRLKLGLDLRGGMYVTLEIDIVRLIEESAQRESIDDIFREVIEKTRVEAKNSDKNVIDIFLNNFNQIARKKGKTLISYFDIGDMRDASEEKVIERLKKNGESAVDQAQQVIRQRIDKFGVAEPTLQKQGTHRLMLELPGVNNEVEMRKLLQTTARLEFNLVRNNQSIVRTFYKIDQILSQQAKRQKGLGDVANVSGSSNTFTADATSTDKPGTTESSATSTQPAAGDTTNPYAGLPEEEVRKKYAEDHPFTYLFQTHFIPPGERGQSQPVNYIKDAFPEGDYSFMIYEPTLKKFNDILIRPDIRALIPLDVKIVREAKPDERILKQGKIKAYSFFALKAEPELTGEVIEDARATFDPTSNQPMVTMSMNTDGSERWARITGANLKKRIAIVLDDQVYSAPTVQSKITGGNSQITGMANTEEAHLLEIVLKAGALKTPVQIIEERVVGPSLGEDSISSGLNASMLATLFVVLFMLVYYAKGGVVADFSVVLNVFIVVAILAAFGGTLSLPGIAGIILTIGMAVDANILIYERIREELRHGRSLRSAVDEGFSKALTAIIDTHVTTFITGLILYFFGTGPIQGFALTLMVGLICTLFTQVVVSRALIDIILANGATHFNFGQPKLDSQKA